MEKQTPQLRTETLVQTGTGSVHKIDNLTNDSGSFMIFFIVGIALFLFFQSPGKNAEKKSSTKNHFAANSEEKKLQDKVKTLEYSIKTIALKKRELENEIRKIEMDSLMDDKSNPYDTELKLDKLKMKLEELTMNEEKKLDEYDETSRSLNEYLPNNQ